jgi:hypothetical protein
MLYGTAEKIEFVRHVVGLTNSITESEEGSMKSNIVLLLVYVCLAPFVFAGLVSFATLQDWRSFFGQMLVVGFVVVSGVTLYFVRRKKSLTPPKFQNAGVEIECVTASPPPDEEGAAWRYLRRERPNGGGQWRNNK